MKKIITISLLCLIVIGLLPLSAVAANNTYILEQPQNYVYNEGAVAIYYVTVAGEHLQCNWYLDYDGKTYNLTGADAGGPWISYVTGDYGSSQVENNLDYPVPHTTFSFFFNGCEAGLDGAYIYADFYNGWDTLVSAKARIQLSAGAKSPPQVSVPAAVEAGQGDKVELTCSATAIYGGALSYTWYETPDGDLTKIVAVDRGTQTNKTLVCDTGTVGTRYYVCAVDEKNGGTAYSSAIPVTVTKKEPTKISPMKVYYHDGDGREMELLKSTDSKREVVVCLDELADSVSGGLVHFVTYTDPLTDEEGKVTFSHTNESIVSRFSYQHNGHDNSDEVMVLFKKAGSTVITAKLANGTKESVTVRVYATRADANAASHTHKLKKVAAKAPTCTADGNVEYYTCEGCDKWFKDAKAAKEITDRSAVIDEATGHTCDFTNWQKDDNEHWVICSVCGEKDEEQWSDHEDRDGDFVCDICRCDIPQDDDSIAPTDPSDTTDPSAPTDPDTTHPTQGATDQNGENHSSDEKKSGNDWLIPTLAAVAAVGVAGGIFFFVKRRKTAESGADKTNP